MDDTFRRKFPVYIVSTANITRDVVRRHMFERVMAIGERDPDVEGEEVLAELEQLDRERTSTITHPS